MFIRNSCQKTLVGTFSVRPVDRGHAGKQRYVLERVCDATIRRLMRAHVGTRLEKLIEFCIVVRWLAVLNIRKDLTDNLNSKRIAAKRN